MNWEKCPYIEKVFKIGGQFYPAIIGQFYAAIDNTAQEEQDLQEGCRTGYRRAGDCREHRCGVYNDLSQ